MISLGGNSPEVLTWKTTWWLKVQILLSQHAFNYNSYYNFLIISVLYLRRCQTSFLIKSFHSFSFGRHMLSIKPISIFILFLFCNLELHKENCMIIPNQRFYSTSSYNRPNWVFKSLKFSDNSTHPNYWILSDRF